MLTRDQAITECKALWKEIEESGVGKDKFLWETEAGKRWVDKFYMCACPLCEYKHSYPADDCAHCPLVENTGQDCDELGYEDGPDDLPTPRFLEAVKNLH